MLLENFYQSFLAWVESSLSRKTWLVSLTAVSVALSLFLAFPPYSLLFEHLNPAGAKLDAWVFIQNQGQDLLRPKDIDYDVRRENMIFRWFLPLLSFLTGHNVVLILLLQGICGVLFLYYTAKYVYELSQDKVITAFFILSISNIFVSTWSFADIHGYGDGFAFFFLLIALLSRRPLIIFIALQAAFFTDERAVVAGGYLLLWWIVTKAWERKDFGLQALIKNAFLGQSAMVWIAWIFYFWVRFYVEAEYFPNHSYSTLGTPVLFASAHRNGLGSSIWAAFEGTWLLLTAAALSMILMKRYLILAALSFGFIILVATGIYVHDIDRALSYGFPFLLISIFVLTKVASVSSIRVILFFTMIICVGHPQVFYMGYNKILWLEPLPLKAVMYLDHIFQGHVFD